MYVCITFVVNAFVFCLDSFCSVYAVNFSFFNPFTFFVTFFFVSLRLNKLSLITPFLSPFVFAQRLYVLWVIPSTCMSLSPALPSDIFIIIIILCCNFS